MSEKDVRDAAAAKRRRAAKSDAVTPSAAKAKSLQSHGKHSVVYVPVILKLFQDRWRPGASTVGFSLDDVRNAVEAVRAVSSNPDRISSRNPADVVYRMRSRTVLPKEILDRGFHVLRSVGRGRYQFEKATSGCRVQHSLAKISGICGQSNLAVAPMSFEIRHDRVIHRLRRPVDVATNSYWQTCSDQGSLKYLCHIAAAKLAPQQFRIENHFNRILRNW
jgi:hypothetical protein